MPKTVNSFRFVDGVTRRVIQTWIKMEEPRPIPWTRLPRPLSKCKVALLSSGGIALKDDKPFDQEGERRNPWWGDPSHRIIPKTASEKDVEIYHLHIDPAFARQDINCLLPIQRLNELEVSGEIGEAAGSHYSIMGYLPRPDEMLEKSVPAIIQQLQSEQVDVLLLIPS